MQGLGTRTQNETDKDMKLERKLGLNNGYKVREGT